MKKITSNYLFLFVISSLLFSSNAFSTDKVKLIGMEQYCDFNEMEFKKIFPATIQGYELNEVGQDLRTSPLVSTLEFEYQGGTFFVQEDDGILLLKLKATQLDKKFSISSGEKKEWIFNSDLSCLEKGSESDKEFKDLDLNKNDVTFFLSLMMLSDHTTTLKNSVEKKYNSIKKSKTRFMCYAENGGVKRLDGDEVWERISNRYAKENRTEFNENAPVATNSLLFSVANKLLINTDRIYIIEKDREKPVKDKIYYPFSNKQNQFRGGFNSKCVDFMKVFYSSVIEGASITSQQTKGGIQKKGGLGSGAKTSLKTTPSKKYEMEFNENWENLEKKTKKEPEIN